MGVRVVCDKIEISHQREEGGAETSEGAWSGGMCATGRSLVSSYPGRE